MKEVKKKKLQDSIIRCKEEMEYIEERMGRLYETHYYLKKKVSNAEKELKECDI